MLTDAKQRLRRPLLPLARGLAGLGVAPDHLTAAGLVAAVASGVALANARPLLAIAALLLSGICDLLDGDVARLLPDRDRRFGAFFDSTADRVAEISVFGGLLLARSRLVPTADWPWLMAWLLALTGGLLVSYARARAEGLGVSCRVGLADRSVRLLLVLLMLALGVKRSAPFLALLAILSWFTVVQRMVHVWRAAARRETG